MEKAYTKIFLKDVRVSVLLGLLPQERERTQEIIVNVELFTMQPAYLKDSTAKTIIDYRGVYELVTGWKNRPHTDLIETLVQDLLGACFAYRDVAACKVSVLKPEIFEYAAGAGVEAFVTRDQFLSLRGT